MAGAGYKVFNAGDILTSSDVNTYLQQQVVMVFNDAAARTTALTSVLAEGMVTYLKDTNTVEVYDGSAWVSTTGDITGITAGTGITVTNPTSATPTVSIDTAVVPRLGNANTFTTGAQTIQTGGMSNVGLIVQAHLAGGQTANLQEWRDFGGNILTLVNSIGRVSINSSADPGGSALNVNQPNGGTGITVNGSGTAGSAINVLPAAGSIGLIIRGAASQTALLQSWQNSSSTAVAHVNPDGRIFGTRLISGSDSSPLGSATIYSSTAALIGVVIRGAASQTADLQQWQNSAGTVLAKVDASGNITGANLVTGRFLLDGSNALPYLDFSSNTLTVLNRAITQVNFVVKGIASQTADLQQWQNNSGTVLAKLEAGGHLRSNRISVSTSGTWFDDASLNVTAYGAAVVGAIVRAAASQTADLQQWQNNSGTVLTAIASSGRILTNQRISIGLPIASPLFTAQANFSNDSDAARIVMLVRGAASQTANLQEWQNSAGTVLASVQSTGRVFAESLQLSGAAIVGSGGLTCMRFETTRNVAMFTGSGGSYGGGEGVAFVANAGVVPTTNPTGGGVLYAEGGALKWRGSSGTVTTIANA